MRLRNRRTADKPVDADGTARCSRCGASVPVRPDGTCDLGHRVTSAEQALLAVPDPAPASPSAPESDHWLEPATDPPPEATGPPREPTTDDLIADAFGENTFARPAPAPASQERDRHDLDASPRDGQSDSTAAAQGPKGDAGPPDDRLATHGPEENDGSVDRPSSSTNTALALEELLDFGADLPPSALDDQRGAS